MDAVKLTRVECPKCKVPLVSKQREEDLLFLCECGTIHVREPDPTVISYEIAEPFDMSGGNMVYVPFWRVSTTVRILDSDVAGGFVYKLSAFFQGSGQSVAQVNVFVPATKLPAEEFRKWSTTLTNNPPRYSRAKDFDRIERMPGNVSRKEAEELADFVILTNEAEKPGTLQRIQYEMTINAMSMVFLPFVRDSYGNLTINL